MDAFTAIFVTLLVILITFDVHHVYRMFKEILFYRFFTPRESTTQHLLAESVISRRCMLFDLDIFMHMNNATYLKRCDIARIKLWHENGVWMNVFRGKGSKGRWMVVGASSSRYRRAITLFQKYEIKTKVIYWDDTAFYVEHQFVRSSDNFVCYVGIIKQSVVGIKTSEVIDKLGYSVEKPEPLPELEKWISSINLSSERLRKRD